VGKIQSTGIASGDGDAPGLKAVIRGLVRPAINEFDWRVAGIRNGLDGLIRPEDCAGDAP